jgi:hypothetical protein
VRFIRIALTAGLTVFSVLVAAGVPAIASTPTKHPPKSNCKTSVVPLDSGKFESWALVKDLRTTTICELAPAQKASSGTSAKRRYRATVTDDADTPGKHFMTNPPGDSPNPPKPPGTPVPLAASARMGFMQGGYTTEFDAAPAFKDYNPKSKQSFKGDLASPKDWVSAFFSSVTSVFNDDGLWHFWTLCTDGSFEEQFFHFVTKTEPFESDQENITGKPANQCSSSGGRPKPPPPTPPTGPGSQVTPTTGTSSSSDQVGAPAAGVEPAR